MRGTTILCDCTEPDGSITRRRITLASLDEAMDAIQDARAHCSRPTPEDFGSIHMQQSIVYYAREALPDNVAKCARILLPCARIPRARSQPPSYQETKTDWYPAVLMTVGLVGILMGIANIYGVLDAGLL